MVYGFTEGPREAAPEEVEGGAMTRSSGCPTGSSSCSIGSDSSIGTRGGSDCSVAVLVGGSTVVSPSGCIGKEVGGTGLCGTLGSSSGSAVVGLGKDDGVRDHLVSSQKISILQ